MVGRLIVAILIGLIGAANAQQTPLDQALSQKLIKEMSENIDLRTQLMQAQERIKELESKAKEDKK